MALATERERERGEERAFVGRGNRIREGIGYPDPDGRGELGTTERGGGGAAEDVI